MWLNGVLFFKTHFICCKRFTNHRFGDKIGLVCPPARPNGTRYHALLNIDMVQEHN